MRYLRVEFSGAVYHVTCRLVGSWREGDRELFRDDRDRYRFLDTLGKHVDEHKVILHQYVLMANHFHLVAETPNGNCSRFMQSLLTSYTVYFNLRHSRHGHLFDGRFKAKLVEGDEYLLTLSRYVHLNPVRVGGLKEQDAATRIKALRSYYWSSYLQYIGRRKRLEFLTTEPTLAMCGGAKRYRGFVEEGVRTVDEEIAAALHTYPLSIGGDQFRDMVQERYAALAGKTASVADVAFGRQLSRLPADIVLDAVCEVLSCSIGQVSVRQKGTPLRPFAAHYLSRYAGLRRREISDILGVQSGQAVTLQIRKYRELVSENRRMRNLAKRCEHALETIRSQQPEAT